MPTNDMLLQDDPAAIAAAARTLAQEAHRALNWATSGEPRRPDAVLAGLMRRVSDLLDRVGEDRMVDLRRWLQALQWRISTVLPSMSNPRATPMSKLLVPIRSFVGREEGGRMAEYVLLSVLISLVCIIEVRGISNGVRGFFIGIPPLD